MMCRLLVPAGLFYVWSLGLDVSCLNLSCVCIAIASFRLESFDGDPASEPLRFGLFISSRCGSVCFESLFMGMCSIASA